MKNSTLVTISLVSTAIITASAAVAMAEPTAQTTSRYRGIENAIEIAFSTGYAGGAGDIDGTQSVEDVADVGAHVELQAGYRFTPNLALAAYGSVTDHHDGDSLSGTNEVVSVTTGLMAAWHFRPTTQIDPWVSAGAGVRYMKIDQLNRTERDLFGIDAARVHAGVDFRINDMFAIGPVIGATVTKFVWDQRMEEDWNEIADRDLSFQLNAGVMGRFDGPVGN